MNRIVLIVFAVFFLSCSNSTEKQILGTKWINVSIQSMGSPFLFEFDKDELKVFYYDRFEKFPWTRSENILSLRSGISPINSIQVFNDSLIVDSKEGKLKLLPFNKLIDESILDDNKADLIKGIWDVESNFINFSKGLKVSYLDFLINGTALWVYGKDNHEINPQMLRWEYFKIQDVRYLRMEGVDENYILITNETNDYVGGLFLGSEFGQKHNLIKRSAEYNLSKLLELTNGSWSSHDTSQKCEGIDFTFESGLGGLYTIYYDVDNLDIEGGDYILSEDLNYLLFNNPDKEIAYPVKIEFVTKDSLKLNFQDIGQEYVFYRDDNVRI